MDRAPDRMDRAPDRPTSSSEPTRSRPQGAPRIASPATMPTRRWRGVSSHRLLDPVPLLLLSQHHSTARPSPKHYDKQPYGTSVPSLRDYGHVAARCRPRSKNQNGVPSMPITPRSPPTPNTTSCTHDIQGSKNPSPTTAAPASTAAPKNSPSRARRGRRAADKRNHRLIRNSQRLRTIQAATMIGAWTLNASTPSTRSGPPTVRTAIADRPSTCVIRLKPRSGNHALSASATGIMNAL